MNIVLARIDDRLIHGQVATVWSKVTGCTRIIVCDDEVAKDTIRATLLKQVAPAGIKSHVVDLEKAQNIVLNEFRAGKLGLVTLDEIPAENAGEEPKNIE